MSTSEIKDEIKDDIITRKSISASTIELNDYEIDVLVCLAELLTTSPSENADLFCKQAKQLSTLVPDRIREILYEFAEHGSTTGFLLFSNLPVEFNVLPKTPIGNTFKLGEKTILARVQAILLNIIGEMIAYQAEGYGRIFQDVIPICDMANDQTSLGSNIELEIHTEQAFSKLRPDILSLGCLRGDVNAFTHILPVQYILDNLTPEEQAMLREPLWKTGVDLSFKLYGQDFIEGYFRGPLSIIHGDDVNDPYLIFDQDLMIGLTDEANCMIRKIVNIYYRHKIVHNLKSGEIILIDNRRAVHGRSAFFPRYNGYDRFLVRCFVTFDYEKSDYARNSNDNRVIQAIYS